MAAELESARLTASSWRLLRMAIGGPREITGKCRRIGRTLRLYVDRAEIRRRFEALQERGLIREQPNRWQIVAGSVDMLRFLITPAARDYYQAKGISFGFHQLLRVLDDPVSMIDPTGFVSDRDTIVGHLMQVVHLNPIYDLQLLSMFPDADGLGELERQVAQMVDGVHPRQRSIGAIVEDVTYHERLLDYVRRFRDDPATPPPVRQEQALRADAEFVRIERTFATLPGFIEYCLRLPSRPFSLVRHAMRGDIAPYLVAR